MPELPDVEGFRRVLASHGAGRRISRVRVLDAGILRDVSERRLCQELEGRTLATPCRHGKWLVSPLRSGRRHRGEEPSLVFHFGMTGSLLAASPEDDRHPHDRLVLVTRDGQAELRYRDLRKLHGVRLVRDDAQLDSLLGELGPDAAAISGEEFRSVLLARRGALKPALMDQTVIAGLGNLLVDEILWRARIHPSQRAAQLDEDSLKTLYRAMRTVLRQSMKDERVPGRRGWLTAQRDAPDGSCPRCGAHLRRSRVGGRSTVSCPRCQRS